MAILYSVRFQPGRFKITPPGVVKAWQIGREDTDKIVGFAFDEEDAKHIVLALNLVDAYIGGNTADQRDLLKALDRFRQ